MKRIRVPGGMLNAARDEWAAHCGKEEIKTPLHFALEATLRWLSENPQVPTDEQAQEILRDHCSKYGYKYGPWPTYSEFCEEWQRRCFRDETNLRMIEAYRRGRNSR